MDWTHEGKSPTTYWEASALNVLAACADRKIWYDNGDDPLYPNLYLVLVGPPGTAKSTTIKRGRKILDRITEIYVAPDEITREQLFVRMETTAHRVYTDPKTKVPVDYTSCNVLSTEWDTFVGEQDINYIKQLCKFYDCEDKFDYETKNNECNYLPNVYFNMIGDIQPEVLPNALPANVIGTGFTSRVIFVVEHEKRHNNPRPKFDQNIKNDLVQIAHEIYEHIGELKFSDVADKRYQEWYMEDKYSSALYGDTRFAAYVERKPQHVIKVAMLMSLSRSHGKSSVIELVDFERAKEWLDRVEIKMGDAFMGFGQNIYAKITFQISEYIRKEEQVLSSKVLSKFWRDVNWPELKKILETLEMQGKITQLKKGPNQVEIRWTKK